MFPMGVVGFFAGFQITVFAFVGIELVGTTAAMAVTPWRRVVPDKSRSCSCYPPRPRPSPHSPIVSGGGRMIRPP